MTTTVRKTAHRSQVLTAWTAKDGLATQLRLGDKVSGEAERLSVSTEAFVGALPGPMTAVMYSQGDATDKGHAKKPWESNSLSFLLTSFLRGAVAAVPERVLTLVPGRARERAGGCPLPRDCGSRCQQLRHCRCCGCCSGHETEGPPTLSLPQSCQWGKNPCHSLTKGLQRTQQPRKQCQTSPGEGSSPASRGLWVG